MRVRVCHRGFTLVELLVVIGIIALLISVLLPALNKARQSANLIACQSNQRQIGVALANYAAENKGFLPYGEVWADAMTGAAFPDSTYNWTWVDTVSIMLKSPRRPGTRNQALRAAPIFRDTDTVLVHNPEGDVCNYTGHPRLFPIMWPKDGPYCDPVTGQPYPLRTLGSVRDPASVLMVWDGAQLLDPGYGRMSGGCKAVAEGLDGWAGRGNVWGTPLNWAHAFVFPNPSNLSWTVDYTRPVLINSRGGIYNSDSPNGLKRSNTDAAYADYWTWCFMRFRHMNNTTGSFLYADGHAESRKIGTQRGEIKLREICMNR